MHFLNDYTEFGFIALHGACIGLSDWSFDDITLGALGQTLIKSDYCGKSSLHWSLSARGDECLQILLDANADVAAKKQAWQDAPRSSCPSWYHSKFRKDVAQLRG